MPVTIDEVSTELVAPPPVQPTGQITASSASPALTPPVAAELSLLSERAERLRAD